MKKDVTIDGTYAYHSYPEGQENLEKHPGLILIEEIWGVNDHIKSVADRFAAEGYSVLAPELLPAGLLEILTPEIQKDLFDPVKRDEVQPKLRAAMAPIAQPGYAEDTIVKLKKCVDFLMKDEHLNGKIAVIGFCFGGTYSFHLAANDGRIKAAVPFYGQPPSPSEIVIISCPMLAFYGEKDAGVMGSLPKLKEDMKDAGRQFESVVYPNVGHAFFNDTNTRMYNADVATDAWNKTLVFLKNNLAV